jgi:hypothetical protein
MTEVTHSGRVDPCVVGIRSQERGGRTVGATIVFSAVCVILFGCGPNPTKLSKATRPAAADPPAAQRLRKAGAQVDCNAHSLNGFRFTSVQLQEALVDQSMISDVAGLPWPVGLFVQNSDLSPSSFEELDGAHGLWSLGFQNCNVDDARLSELHNLPRLTSFSVDSGVTGKGLLFLDNSPELKSLAVRNAPLEDSELVTLLGHHRLVALDVAGTHVTDTGLRALSRQTRLKQLELGGCAVTDNGLRWIASLESLESLDLSKTMVTDAGLAELTNLSHLQNLGLRDTAITDSGLPALAALQFKKLIYLGVKGSKVTRAGLARVLPRVTTDLSQ